MPKRDIKMVKLGSLENKIQQLMQMITKQKFHVVGLAKMHTAVIPEVGKKSLPKSLANAVNLLNTYLATPEDSENIELFKVGQDPDEVKRARGLAQFAAILQVATESNHASRHPETQKFYEKCIKHILDEPLLKKDGVYYEEFQERYDDSLFERRLQIINPKYLQIIHRIERVFKMLVVLEEHLEEYIPDIATTEDPAKYFLLISAKQMLLCRSEKELNQCLSDFKFALKHSGLTKTQQTQMTDDIENYHGNYKMIFHADRRKIKLINAAALHIGALGINITSFLGNPALLDSIILRDLTGGIFFDFAGDKVKASTIEGYFNILDIPNIISGHPRHLADLLAPYLLNTGKSLGKKIKEGISKAAYAKLEELKEKPATQLGLAATATSIVGLSVPPLAPILLPTAACLTLVSAALSGKETLSEVWATNALISKECDLIKLSYERDYNMLIQTYGTSKEIAANQKRADKYIRSNKPDLELINPVEASSNKSASTMTRYSLFKSQHDNEKHMKEKEALDKKKTTPP